MAIGSFDRVPRRACTSTSERVCDIHECPCSPAVDIDSIDIEYRRLLSEGLVERTAESLVKDDVVSAEFENGTLLVMIM